jgi:hypothetical protein
MVKFSDGVKVHTQGPLKVIKLPNGYYVVGQGMLIPVNDRADGEQMIRELNGVNKKLN